MVISGMKWAFKLLFRLGLELLQSRSKVQKTFRSQQLCGVLPEEEKNLLLSEAVTIDGVVVFISFSKDLDSRIFLLK